MRDQRRNGVTSYKTRVKIIDTRYPDGRGLTGLTHASSGLIISTIADNEASATAYTAAGSTIETIAAIGTYATPTATKCRFAEVDATNHPGLYEIQLANARLAVSGATELVVTVSGASNMAQVDIVVRLAAITIDSADASGRPNVNVDAMTANVLTASALASDAVTEIATAIFVFDVDQTEATAGADTLTRLVLQGNHFSSDANSITVKRTNDSTTFCTIVITTSSTANAIITGSMV